jgi:hypothetical protein
MNGKHASASATITIPAQRKPKVRKPNWKHRYASNLDEAIELCADHAGDKLRRPAKVMADLMGVELKTYYRWLAESSMPLNRLRQFEAFTGASYISDYLYWPMVTRWSSALPAAKGRPHRPGRSARQLCRCNVPADALLPARRIAGRNRGRPHRHPVPAGLPARKHQQERRTGTGPVREPNMTSRQYSATELLALKLPVLPGSKVALLARADKEHWPYQESRGRGGKRRLYTPPAYVMDAMRQAQASSLINSEPAPPRHPACRSAKHGPNPLRRCPSWRVAGAAIADAPHRLPDEKAAALLLDMARLGTASEQLQAMLKLARDERGRPSPDGLPSVRSLLRLAEYQQQGRLAPAQRQPQLTAAVGRQLHAPLPAPEKPTLEHAYRQFAAQ